MNALNCYRLGNPRQRRWTFQPPRSTTNGCHSRMWTTLHAEWRRQRMWRLPVGRFCFSCQRRPECDSQSWVAGISNRCCYGLSWFRPKPNSELSLPRPQKSRSLLVSVSFACTRALYLYELPAHLFAAMWWRRQVLHVRTSHLIRIATTRHSRTFAKGSGQPRWETTTQQFRTARRSSIWWRILKNNLVTTRYVLWDWDVPINCAGPSLAEIHASHVVTNSMTRDTASHSVRRSASYWNGRRCVWTRAMIQTTHVSVWAQVRFP